MNKKMNNPWVISESHRFHHLRRSTTEHFISNDVLDVEFKNRLYSGCSKESTVIHVYAKASKEQIVNALSALSTEKAD